jgi:hypothetical protein
VVFLDEKERMLILAFFVFLLFGLISVLDGAFTVLAVFPYNAPLKYWLYVMFTVMSASTFIIALATVLADNHDITREDITGALLIFGQSWILLWGGLLDLISRTTQAYFWYEPSMLNYLREGFDWVWLDPPATSNIPLLPYLISRLFGYASTQHIGIVLGSFISIVIVVLLWAIYYEYA